MITRTQALALQKDVNDVLKALRLRSDGDDCRKALGPVNWADLSCTDVEVRTSLLHDCSIVAVIVEEASRDAEGLKKFVGERLEQLGWRDVYVETEW